jgi:hypothetical protein
MLRRCLCCCDDGSRDVTDRARLLPPGADSPMSAPTMDRFLPPAEKSPKRALLIGINYMGTSGELKGCCNDVRKMQAFLLSHGWSAESMLCLTDEPPGKADLLPTRMNILAGMRWLIADVAAGDSLFFHFSGHGGQQVDTHGDEEDGYDETICPLDFERAGQISDDELFERLVHPLPAGVRLTAVLDCCHSGHGMECAPPPHSAHPRDCSALPPPLLAAGWPAAGLLRLG